MPDRLPAIPSPGVLEEEIVDGEIVDDAPPRLPARAVRVVVVAVHHPATVTTGRHVSYVWLGGAVLARRAWDSRTTARFERHMRAAELAGDRESAREWEVLRQAYLNDRHRRRMERRKSAVEAFRAAPWIAGGTVGVLGGIGLFLAIAERNAAAVAVPFRAAGDIVLWIVIVISVSYGPFLLAVPWIALAGLYWAGKKHAQSLPGGWLAAPAGDEEDAGLVVTADTIVLALQHLPVPELKKAFKDGWHPTFTLQPVRDGRGYEAECSVPLGVTADMIADRRAVLARNLHREEIETWITAGTPGHVRLWVADRGAMDSAAPEYPLLHEGSADVFEGVPAGVTPRGDEIRFPIVEANGVFGGMPGQGKSNDVRVVLLGCSLDPLCGIDVFVFANNGDFDAYRPRLAVYEKGLDDDVIDAAVFRLQELYDEVGRREGRLSELRASKITRQMAAEHPDMRPLVAAFSECHELFGHKKDGKLSDQAKLAAELAVKTVKRGRKTGVTLLFDTQSSRKNAIPPELVEQVSVNCCHAVKSWRNNDGFLGDGCFQAGIRATELRPGRDVGRTVATGVSDAQYELLMWHYVHRDNDTGFDAATDVIARAMQLVDPRTPVAAGGPRVIEVRDLLTDLDQVLGAERVRLADVPALLRDHAPTWLPYRRLTGVQLREELERERVRVKTTGGILWLDPPDLRAVMTRREMG